MMHILAAVNHMMIILSMNMVKILFFVEVGATQLNLSMIILSINVVKFLHDGSSSPPIPSLTSNGTSHQERLPACHSYYPKLQKAKFVLLMTITGTVLVLRVSIHVVMNDFFFLMVISISKTNNDWYLNSVPNRAPNYHRPSPGALIIAQC